MMRRLLKLSIILTGILAVAFATPRVVMPHQQMPFPLNTLTSAPDCEWPCWHGIQPGVTPYEDAVAMLAADPAFRRVSHPDESMVSEWQVGDSPTDRVLIYQYTGDVAYAIQLFGHASPGEAVLALGTPDRSYTNPTCVWEWLLIYPSARVNFLNEDGPDAPLPGPKVAQRIMVDLDAPELAQKMVFPDSVPWRGFRPVEPPATVDCGGAG
jgi:hypothetical protein